MKRLNNQLEAKLGNFIVELIRDNQKNIVGAYVVPFSFGEAEKLQITLVESAGKEVIESNSVEIENTKIIVTSSLWDMYQNEKDFNDSFYMGNYLQIRDLKNAEIVYDPTGALASKKEELRKKPGTMTYFNLSMFFQSVIHLSKERLQGIPEVVDKQPLEEREPSKRKRRRKRKNDIKIQ